MSITQKCLWHTGVEENDRADSLVGKATLTSCLLLGESELLRNLRHYVRDIAPSIALRREAWKEEALEIFLEKKRESHRESDDTGTVSKATFGKLLSDGVERIWLFRLHNYHLQQNWTELKVCIFTFIRRMYIFHNFKWRICILRWWNTRHAQSRRAFLLLLLLSNTRQTRLFAEWKTKQNKQPLLACFSGFCWL